VTLVGVGLSSAALLIVCPPRSVQWSGSVGSVWRYQKSLFSLESLSGELMEALSLMVSLSLALIQVPGAVVLQSVVLVPLVVEGSCGTSGVDQ